MGQGLGQRQRAMLAALEPVGSLTIAELTEMLGLASFRWTREVARTLEARGLVIITTGVLTWKGAGQFGRLVSRRKIERYQPLGDYEWIDLESVPVISVKKGELWPGSVDEKTARDNRIAGMNEVSQLQHEGFKAGLDATGDERVKIRREYKRKVAAAERRKTLSSRRSTAREDVDFIRIGVPVYGLTVWSIEGRRAWRASMVEVAKFACDFLGRGAPTEAELIEHYGPEVGGDA